MRARAIFLILVGAFGLAGSASAGTYSGGTGEPNDPYRIATANDLNDIGNHSNDWDKHFLMVNDINLADYTGAEFNMIGYLEAWHSTENEPFSGVFDGNGHAVWNFTHVSTDKDAVGLFRYVFGPDAEIRDVALADPNLDSGRDGVGALVGWLRAGRVMGCQVRGGRVSGSFATGGLVGDNSGIISGSLAAVYNSGVVSDCYAVGDVFGMDLVGGLVGSNIHGAISNSYATGFVSGALINGGLLGDHLGTISGCFWDTETSGTNDGVASVDPDPEGAKGKTTAEMQTESTFTDAGWDFVQIWDIGGGQTYPFLRVYSAGDLNHDGWVDFFDVAILADDWLEGK
jgi:hypothetical protein